jgi:hypothetical protein
MSAIWKAVAEKAGPLADQMHAFQPDQLSSLHLERIVPGLKGAEFAEMAVALEGEKILSDLQSGQFTPDSGFVIVVRLTAAHDAGTLIQQALEALDQQKPGLRGQIEKSRRRLGAAELFDVPVEGVGGPKLPFKVSGAVGPAADGTIIALGRSETLEAFLSGKTEGKLRGQANDTLSRRGQIWLYLPVPKDASKSFGGAAGLGANPMLAGLAQSMEKVREVSLSLNFAASQLDFELDFGCTDAATAAQLSQGMQGLLGMMQMGLQQNPSSTPPFVGKIKAAAEGASVRLTTAFTTRDFDLAFQSVSHGVAPPRPSTSRSKPAAAPAPAPVEAQSPVEVEFVQFSSEEQESLRTAKMRIRNRSTRPVREIKMTFVYLDAVDRKLGQWTRTHASLTSENLVGAAVTQVVDCLAFNVPAFTKKVTVTLNEVTFANGEKWGRD